jgi:26S proteasome regulatory subunit N5
LTEIYIKNHDIEEASKLVQDIQIETFGSIERAYKVDYILFQMRVLLKKGDYIRMLIVSNKINRKHLNEVGLEKLKVEFYNLIIQYYLHEERYIDVAKSYKVLYDFVKEINEKINRRDTIKEETMITYNGILRDLDISSLFTNYVMFLSICPPELETKNMLNELNLNYKKDLDRFPDMKAIVQTKLSDEVVQINGSFLVNYQNYEVFQLNDGNHHGKKHSALFRKYFIQHDLNIFQKFFSQVRMSRISAMVGIEVHEVETELADMVINNYIWARINRIGQTVNFKPKSDHTDRLNDINYDLMKMLEKIENTCHLIHKENLKHDIK